MDNHSQKISKIFWKAKMFPHRIRVFSVCTLYIIVISWSFSCTGILLEEEQQSHRHPPSSTTPLSALTEKLARDRDIFKVSLPAISMESMEDLLIQFLRIQGFIISDRVTAFQEDRSIRRIALREKKLTLKRKMERTTHLSLSSDSLESCSKLMSSREFSVFLEDSACRLLLRNLQKQLNDQSSDFLTLYPVSSKTIVFCPHPQEIDDTFTFLNLFYNALAIIFEIEKTPLVPKHPILKGIFDAFNESPDNKEKVLTLWGAPLLESIVRFYNQENIFLQWQCIAQALELIKRTLTAAQLEQNSTQTPKDTVPQAHRKSLTCELSRINASCALAQYIQSNKRTLSVTTIDIFPLLLTLKHTSSSQDISFNRIYAFFNELLRLTAHQLGWKGPLLEEITQFYKREKTLLQWHSIAEALELIKIKLTKQLEPTPEETQIDKAHSDHRESLVRELSRVTATHTLAQYFRQNPEIQFTDPDRTRSDLFPLILGLSHTSPSRDPSFNDIYASFDKLLKSTAYQVGFIEEEATKTVFPSLREEEALPLLSSLTLERRLLIQKIQRNEGILFQKARDFDKTVSEARQNLEKLQTATKKRAQSNPIHELDLLNAQERHEIAQLTGNLFTAQYLKAVYSFSYIQHQFFLDSKIVQEMSHITLAEDKLNLAKIGLKQQEARIKELQRQVDEVNQKYRSNRKKLQKAVPQSVTSPGYLGSFFETENNPSFFEFIEWGIFSEKFLNEIIKNELRFV